MSEPDGLGVVGSLRSVPDAKQDKIILQPLALSDFATAREEALDWFRRDYLKTYAKNADLLPNSEELIREKFEEMANKRYEHLPTMDVIEYENDAIAWQLEPEDRVIKDVHRMEYVMWWISVNTTGMLFALWLSAKREPSQRNITQEELERRFQDEEGTMDMQSLEQAAQKLGVLSQPDTVGNGEAPVDGGKKKRREARAKRRARRERK
jgi:hypothetical protein